MAKFTGGYTPVTWKNVPVGNPSQFFNGVIQAGDVLFDQQTELNEREDLFRTNEALNADRLGQPRAFDRRVDQNALQLAGGYEDTLKSNLLTAGLEQEKLQIDIDESPERLDLLRQEIQAKLNSASSAAEANRYQRQLNDIALAEDARIKKEREQISKFADNTTSVFDGYLTKAQEDYDARNVPGADTLAGQTKRYNETQAIAQQKTAEYLGNREGIKDTGLPSHLRPQTPAGIAETAASNRERSDAEVIRAYNEGLAGDEQSNYVASENDLRAFIVDENGVMGFGKPTEHALSTAEAELMLRDAADKNKSLKFRLEDIETETNKRLANAAATLSPSVAREITANVVEASKLGGGSMNAEEFVDAWFKEAQRYRNVVFPEFRDRYKKGDTSDLTGAELFDLNSRNVVKTDSVSNDDVGTINTASTAERLTARGLNLEVHPDKAGNSDYLRDVNVLMDAIDSNHTANGRPLSSDQVELVKQQLRAALLKLAKPPLGPLPDNIRERNRP